MRVELLANPGCPHVEATRELLRDCLAVLDLDAQITDRVGHYASPTVLVDGIDVMGRPTPSAAEHACRLDLPTRPRLLAALRAHFTTSSTPPNVRWEPGPPSSRRTTTGG